MTLTTNGLMLKPIPGFPGYFASEDGYIWSAKNTTIRRLKQTRSRNGYLRVRPYCGQSDRLEFVHRLILLTFVGPCPDGMECRHLDGDRANNAASNLAWGTHTENMLDRTRHGRAPKTLGLIARKHSAETVATALRMRADRRPVREIMAATGISYGHLYQLFAGKFLNGVPLPEGMPSGGATRCRGERHPYHKLTSEQVAEIRRRRAAGDMLKDIARDYSITTSGVWSIANGRSRTQG